MGRRTAIRNAKESAFRARRMLANDPKEEVRCWRCGKLLFYWRGKIRWHLTGNGIASCGKCPSRPVLIGLSGEGAKDKGAIILP